MSATREEVISLLDRLSDASIEDIEYHLYVIEKARNCLEAAQTEGAITQEQAEKKLRKWLIP